MNQDHEAFDDEVNHYAALVEFVADNIDDNSDDELPISERDVELVAEGAGRTVEQFFADVDELRKLDRDQELGDLAFRRRLEKAREIAAAKCRLAYGLSRIDRLNVTQRHSLDWGY